MQRNLKTGIGVILCSLFSILTATSGNITMRQDYCENQEVLNPDNVTSGSDSIMRRIHCENQQKFISDSIFLLCAQIDDDQIIKILQDTVIPFARSKGFSPDSLNIYIQYWAHNQFRDPRITEEKKLWPQYYWYNRFLVITIENTHNSPWTDTWAAYSQIDGYIIFLDRQFYRRFAYRNELKPYRWFKCGLNRDPSECYRWEYRTFAKINPFVAKKYNPKKDEKSSDYSNRIGKNAPFVPPTDGTGDVW